MKSHTKKRRHIRGITKRASLNLSVNAIVILIMAIAMLGLGLGFVKNTFGKLGGSLEEAASNEPDPASATSSNKIQLSKDTLVLESKGTGIVKASVYNPYPDTSVTASLQLKCGAAAASADNPPFLAKVPETNTKDIEPQTASVFIIQFASDKVNEEDNKLCMMTAIATFPGKHTDDQNGDGTAGDWFCDCDMDGRYVVGKDNAGAGGDIGAAQTFCQTDTNYCSNKQIPGAQADFQLKVKP